MTTTSTLSGRDRAILRAVAAGGAQLQLGSEPDLFLDGRCCCDQAAAHHLFRDGLITAATLGRIGQRVAAVLTPAGQHAPRRLTAHLPRLLGVEHDPDRRRQRRRCSRVGDPHSVDRDPAGSQVRLEHLPRNTRSQKAIQHGHHISAQRNTSAKITGARVGC